MRSFPLCRTLVVLPLAALILAACSNQPTPATKNEANILSDQVAASIQNFKTTDPTMNRFFRDAYGYAVFPAVRAAAVGVGGAYGQAEVYEKGRFIGHADLSQANIGASLGGQRYAEIIFFENEGAMATFKTTQVEFDARASAVAASNGAGTSANYQKGVAIFTLPEAGLMFQAAVGGQKFRFTPLDRNPPNGWVSNTPADTVPGDRCRAGARMVHLAGSAAARRRPLFELSSFYFYRRYGAIRPG